MNSCFSSSFIPYQSVSSHSTADTAQLSIRVAQLSDIKCLADVLINSFHPYQGIGYWTYPLLKLGIYEDLRNRLRSKTPYFACLVAITSITNISKKSEDVVGTVEVAMRSTYSWLSHSYQYPYISNLAVSNSYRRQGIARKLLLRCEQTAQEWGFKEIFLHVLENNYQARQLYSSSGYQLYRIESSFMCWLFKRPRRLLLKKKISTR